LQGQHIDRCPSGFLSGKPFQNLGQAH
jgi:hypothetical protein